jgi:transmembrane protein 216
MLQWIFTYTTLVLLFYKTYAFTFPALRFSIEILALVVLQVIQFTRIYVGSRGNKLESSGTTALFILMTLGSMVGVVYFLALQTYVLKIEELICFSLLVLAVCEFLFSCFALIEFKALESAQ